MEWTIKRKLVVGFGAAALMLLGCILLAWRGASNAAIRAQRVQQSYAIMKDIEHLKALSQAVDDAVRGYLIAAEEDQLAELPALRQDQEETIARMKSAISVQLQQERLDKFYDLLKQRRVVVGDMITVEREEGFERASQLFATHRDAQMLDQMKGVLGAMQVEEQRLLAESMAADENARRMNELELGASGIVVLLLLIGLGYFIPRSIDRNLRCSLDLLESMTRKDLSVADGVPASKDELAHSIYAINALKQSMRDVIGAVTRISTQVASAGSEISLTSQQIAENVGSERDQATQVASAMQEMSISVQEVASHSGEAAQAASRAVETAKVGSGIVVASLGAMERIAATVTQASDDISSLGKQTESIGEVVNIIEDIAGQTNLLALNATIEAARAGEQGKGFAVVAGEIRRLAERTSQFTKEIAQKVDAVQAGSQTAVTSMNAGQREVDRGVEEASKAKGSLEEIVSTVERAQERISMIATAAAQQSVAAAEVTQTMEKISQGVTTTAVGAEQTAQACAELAKLAQELQGSVDGFRLQSDAVPARSMRLEPRSLLRQPVAGAA